jgi:hypothetical protein
METRNSLLQWAAKRGGDGGGGVDHGPGRGSKSGRWAGEGARRAGGSEAGRPGEREGGRTVPVAIATGQNRRSGGCSAGRRTRGLQRWVLARLRHGEAGGAAARGGRRGQCQTYATRGGK